MGLIMLIANLKSIVIPETVISQAFSGSNFSDMPVEPISLIEKHIQRCVSCYFEAAGQGAV
ncbi:unnamed protein product [Ectocarpus sp. 12 AP-2014]